MDELKLNEHRAVIDTMVTELEKLGVHAKVSTDGKYLSVNITTPTEEPHWTLSTSFPVQPGLPSEMAANALDYVVERMLAHPERKAAFKRWLVAEIAAELGK